ncbi:uncharacterized protein P884DRAFT_317904 [Thermothelomyces heterothallicus CBS 202.75]|uniref:uncharacterized protein n=1 Tax=Thermothelomyces heterothallicus CBS 202.75 TaxID=1149848 RepID=UPI0037423AF3
MCSFTCTWIAWPSLIALLRGVANRVGKLRDRSCEVPVRFVIPDQVVTCTFQHLHTGSNIGTLIRLMFMAHAVGLVTFTYTVSISSHPVMVRSKLPTLGNRMGTPLCGKGAVVSADPDLHSTFTTTVYDASVVLSHAQRQTHDGVHWSDSRYLATARIS